MLPPSRTRGSSVLRWVLTSLVIGVVAGATFVVAFSIARSVVDEARPRLPLTIAGTLGLVAAVATARRIDSAVVDLIDGIDDHRIAAIAALDHDLAAGFGPDRYLSELAQTAASLLRVPYVRLDVDPVVAEPGRHCEADRDDTTWSSRLSRSYGTTDRAPRVLARRVRLGSLDIGRITVGRRVGGGEFSDDDVAALDAIARQAAMAISNARQAEALHRSRERAVLGIEEERRRLRRDLHDELGPNLAAMKLRLGVLRRSGDLSPAATTCVEELSREVDGMTADVRRLVERLRPLLLDDLGLTEALRCLNFVPDDLHLTVESDFGLEGLPAATQVALYRIGSEAIRNVVSHADARTCTVRLTRTTEAVTLTVIDDGGGIADDRSPGVGIAAMSERADELGGLVTVSSGVEQRGCCIAATIPLPPTLLRPVSDATMESPT